MNTKPARIFVVEDNEPDLMLIREALRMTGLKWEITHFKDGADALAGFERTGHNGEPIPDLIFLDLNIPKITGLEVLVSARSKTLLQNVPIVILTSSQSHDDRSQSLGLGATSYVTKPFELNEFLTVVGDIAMQLLSKPIQRHA
jgi:chemotaxis family two-component system response regulator Rcp1